MTNFMEIGICTVELLIDFFYLNGVLGKKENIGIRAWMCFGAALIFNIIRSYFYFSFPINISLSIIMWMFLAVTCFKGKVVRKMYFVIVAMIAIIVADMLTALPLSMFARIEYGDVEFAMRFLGMIMTNFLLFVFSIYIIYIEKKKYRQLPLKFNILMILCPLFSIFLLLLLHSYISQAHDHHYIASLMAVIGLGYINVMIFNFFDHYEKGIRVTAMDMLLSANEENYKLLEENERELHIMRHDILNHMSEIKEMINKNNNQAAEKYVEELNQIVSKNTAIARTGDLTLDTILNVEGKKAIAAGIKYDVKLNIDAKILVSSVDLSRILYNAIDNAIEACEKVSQKYILISVVSDKQNLKIVVENTSPEIQIDGNTIKTSKKNLRRHGYGLKSIKEAAEKYGGMVSLSYDNGIFCCRIILNNMEK